MIDIVDRSDSAHAQGRIGPDIAWHNAYYNRSSQPFLWNEESIRSQRVGVLDGRLPQPIYASVLAAM